MVRNTPKSLPKSNEIYDEGFTTKNNHDGLGFSIVKHLLTSQAGSSITHKIDGKTITFTITLIGR
jgi:sensor histidine kinase regulating citrate/malate metabolism